MDLSSITNLVSKLTNQDEFLKDLNDSKFDIIRNNYPQEWCELQYMYQSDVSRVRQKLLDELSQLLNSIKALEDKNKEQEKMINQLSIEIALLKQSIPTSKIRTFFVCTVTSFVAILLVLLTIKTLNSDSYRTIVDDSVLIIRSLGDSFKSFFISKP